MHIQPKISSIRVLVSQSIIVQKFGKGIASVEYLFCAMVLSGVCIICSSTSKSFAMPHNYYNILESNEI
jgi:hypothetical protein